MTKGVMISAWGKRGYIYAAYNLAFSIKNFNRRLPVYLYCDPSMLAWLREDERGVFDDIIPIPVSVLTQNAKEPAKIKTSAYDHLPCDYTLLLDVDALALRDLEPMMDEMIAEGGYFYTHIFNLHKLEQGNDIPHMVWARANDIWNKYNLPQDAVLPCSNSSIQFIKKGEDSARLFKRVKDNLNNPIPLNQLKTQWGAAQPDELYLNIAMAQEKITGKPSKEYMFLGFSLSPDPFHKIVEKYPLLSIFGGKNFTKLRYTEWYDKLNINYHRAHGKRPSYKFPVIVRDKHANTRPIKSGADISRFQVESDKYVNDVFNHGNTGEKIHIYSGWFRSQNEERQKELDLCLTNNLKNKEVEKVFIIGDDDCPIQNDKLTVIKTVRPTYNTFFGYINANADEDTISLICNGDIYIDEENARKLRAIDFNNRVLALSRWEVDINNFSRHFAYEWSQDVWAFRGKVRPVSCDSHLGVMQCDNRIASELKAAGYEVVNPSRDIKTFHIHKTGIRTYDVHATQEGEKIPVPPTGAKEYLKKRMLIIQPGKVGDIILCAPIASVFSDEYFIDWQCPKGYHTLFNSLPYIRPVTDYVEKHYQRVIDLSFGLGGKPDKWWQENKKRFNSFVEAKYELAGLPHQIKNNLKWVRNLQRENALYELIKKDHKFDYILVHDSSDYGTPIKVEAKEHKIVKFQPILDYTIFDWYKVIMRAKEIHCIDSSLCNFVDAIKDVPGKLFYYKTDKVPQKWDETLLTKNWHYDSCLTD